MFTLAEYSSVDDYVKRIFPQKTLTILSIHSKPKMTSVGSFFITINCADVTTILPRKKV